MTGRWLVQVSAGKISAQLQRIANRASTAVSIGQTPVIGGSWGALSAYNGR